MTVVVPKTVYELDGSRIHDLRDFYAEVSRVLIPGVDWGRNLDAFHDILRGGFGTPQEGFTLVWLGSEQSRLRLGHAETARVLEEQLAGCHPSNRPAIAERLAAARAQVGPTVFDKLLDIIHRHPDISLVLK
jgi:RNAse (barnase) inhibitor barstar